MINEAIILAGGLGTRLRSVVADLPKCMAPVAGNPFLHYLITHLKKEGIQNFIFSTGYKSEMIESYLKENHSNISFSISLEEEPLGTGGAIQLAFQKSLQENSIICNGDTLFNVHLTELSALHLSKDAACTLSLKPMKDFNRYGVVSLAENNCIESFKEKQFYSQGLINGGIYALNKKAFLSKKLPSKFSFEKDFLERFVYEKKMYGLVQTQYFIDIGIPEDYQRAQLELVTT